VAYILDILKAYGISKLCTFWTACFENDTERSGFAADYISVFLVTAVWFSKFVLNLSAASFLNHIKN
jgi:hypothetical protein